MKSVSETIYTRRDFLRTMALGAASLASPAALQAAQEAGTDEKRPNVLFIAVDDLRPQIACYGHKQMISPNIDRLASNGVIFSRCYCQVPVCGASRASLLTGVRPTPERFLNYATGRTKTCPAPCPFQSIFAITDTTPSRTGRCFTMRPIA